MSISLSNLVNNLSEGVHNDEFYNGDLNIYFVITKRCLSI